MLLVVEQGAHPGSIGATQTQPGKGVYNDIWLATADGSRAWRLTDIPVSPNDGIIWPRFDRTGTEIVWSHMYQGADLHHPLGQWALKTADLRWDAWRLWRSRRGRHDHGQCRPVHLAEL